MGITQQCVLTTPHIGSRSQLANTLAVQVATCSHVLYYLLDLCILPVIDRAFKEFVDLFLLPAAPEWDSQTLNAQKKKNAAKSACVQSSLYGVPITSNITGRGGRAHPTHWLASPTRSSAVSAPKKHYSFTACVVVSALPCTSIYTCTGM